MSQIITHTRIDSALERVLPVTAVGNSDPLDLLQAGGLEDIHVQLEPSNLASGDTATVKIQGATEDAPETWVDIKTVSLTADSTATVMRPVIDPPFRYVRAAVTTKSSGTAGEITLRILV